MSMTSLERIKKIEKDVDWILGQKDGQFLLKAFQVMRDIAAKRSGYNWVDLDKEFEEGMK